MYIYKILLVLFFFFYCYYFKKLKRNVSYSLIFLQSPFEALLLFSNALGGIKKEMFMLLASIYCIMKKNLLCVSSLSELLLVWNVNQSHK